MNIFAGLVQGLGLLFHFHLLYMWGIDVLSDLIFVYPHPVVISVWFMTKIFRCPKVFLSISRLTTLICYILCVTIWKNVCYIFIKNQSVDSIAAKNPQQFPDPGMFRKWDWGDDADSSSGPYRREEDWWARVPLNWVQSQLVRNTFPRGDYRELCELITFILRGEVSSYGLIWTWQVP